MAESVFKHNDDDGTLSIFTSGDEVLFACSKGHWWIISATSSGKTAKAAALRANRGLSLKKPTRDDVKIQDLTAKFGPDVLRAMRFK